MRASKGEDLNIVSRSYPLPDLKEDAFKQHILNLLQQQYGIEEEDFASAELQARTGLQSQRSGTGPLYDRCLWPG